MPRKAITLTSGEIDGIRLPGMTAVGGATGLYLRVSEAGARSWIVRLPIAGKRRDMGLGGLDVVSLEEARRRAKAARAHALNGGDPIAMRKHERDCANQSVHLGVPEDRNWASASAPQLRERTPLISTHSRSGEAVTLGDVAKLAGVSPMSASRALNSPLQVSQSIKERVRAAVRSTGYVPNKLAAGLASRHSRLVAAIVPSLAGSVFQEMVQSLVAELRANEYQVMLGQSGYGIQEEDGLLEAIIGRRPDGLVLGGVIPSEAGCRQLIASRIPVVQTWDMVRSPIDMLVGFSHENIATQVADLLVQRGRRHLAFVGGNHERALRRANAFVKAAAQHGTAIVPAPSVITVAVDAPAGVGSGRGALKAILSAQPHTDAVFCSSDLLALGVLTEARAIGLQVPAQLAVVGFGDLPFAADVLPALTTVRVDGRSIGALAARFIIERAQGRAPLEPVVDLGFSIVERDST